MQVKSLRNSNFLLTLAAVLNIYKFIPELTIAARYLNKVYRQGHCHNESVLRHQDRQHQQGPRGDRFVR